MLYNCTQSHAVKLYSWSFCKTILKVIL
uniref:Uncharacterized protein n=1 Tax=Anguilla anguilla TaxID=7936 RepID=A0A0E9Q101_ANGAN